MLLKEQCLFLREVSHLLKIMALHIFVLLLFVHIHVVNICATQLLYAIWCQYMVLLYSWIFIVKLSNDQIIIYTVVCYCKCLNLLNKFWNMSTTIKSTWVILYSCHFPYQFWSHSNSLKCGFLILFLTWPIIWENYSAFICHERRKSCIHYRVILFVQYFTQYLSLHNI